MRINLPAGPRFSTQQGTDGAVSPFWSPDSKNLAFGVGSALKKVDVVGGTVAASVGESVISEGVSQGTSLLQLRLRMMHQRFASLRYFRGQYK